MNSVQPICPPKTHFASKILKQAAGAWRTTNPELLPNFLGVHKLTWLHHSGRHWPHIKVHLVSTNELHWVHAVVFSHKCNILTIKKQCIYIAKLQNIPQNNYLLKHSMSLTQGTCTWDSCITIRIVRTNFPSSGWSHRAKVLRNCVATFGRHVHSETAVASTSFTSKVFYSTKLGGKHVENHPMLKWET